MTASSPLIAVTLLVLIALASPVSAQSISDQVRSVDDGQVRFSFAAREGVCGDGDRISTHRQTEDWEGPCESGPVRVAIDVENGEVVDIDTCVGGRWRPRAGTVDLSIVSVREATDFLLSLAESSSIDVSERAIFPVTIADSVEVWPRLLRLAKDDSRPREVRKAAVFWEVALMALSQLPESRGVPALLDVARTSEDREMRKRAIFWLGQTDDPQALALLEEILTSRR